MPSYKTALATSAAFMQCFGNAIRADDSTSVAVALVLNDTVDLIRLSGGTRLQEIEFDNDDFDTGTTLQIKIGYRSAQPDGVLATNDAYFGTGFTFLQAPTTNLTRQRLSFAPVDFNEDVIIFATVTAAAAGQAAGAKKITTFATGIAKGTK
jgi:hypothetical protein